MQIIPKPESLLIRDVDIFLAFSANDQRVGELERASAAVEIRRDDYQIILRDGTPATVVGWGVWWYGVQHGGRAADYMDATYHADRLRHAPDWDRAAWVARHQGRVAVR